MIVRVIPCTYNGDKKAGIWASFYGVMVAHGTLNPLVGVRASVGALFFSDSNRCQKS